MVDEFFSENFPRRGPSKVHNLFISLRKKHALNTTGYNKIKGTVRYAGNMLKDLQKLTSKYERLDDSISRDKSKILSLVFSEEENDCNVSVIPIFCELGLGKSVLARSIFDDDQVRREFDPKIWVRVFELSDTRELLLSMYNSLKTDHKISEESSLSNEELEDLLRKEIAKKKFLLVLEDLISMEDEKWQCLRGVLRSGERGSTVIITTSNEDVAEKTGTKRPFRLDDNSRYCMLLYDLLHIRVVPERTVSKWFRFLFQGYGMVSSKPILKTIVDIFYHNYEPNFRNSMSNTHHDEDRLDKIEIDSSLFQRYVQLPFHLKQCFEYCRLFPRDYEIDVQTLLNLWMAQGFIKLSDPSQCLEDLGRQYFMDLLDRGFFQEVPRSDHFFDNLVTKCKIGHSEYNLSIITGGLRYALLRPHGENYIDDRITHHVSFDFHLHSQSQIPKTMKRRTLQIRSILLPHQWKYEEGMIDAEKILHIIAPDQSGWVSVHGTPGLVSDVIISKFQSLRALDLHDMGMKVVPYYIDTLKHLRYLDLSRNADIKALPASLTKLLYLQTLKLSHCIGLEELPKDTKNLVILRSLEIDGCYNLTHMPPGLGQLTNLLVLSQFVVKKHVGNSHGFSHRKKSSSAFRKSSELNELGKLKNLRGEMQIKNSTPVTDAKAALLEEKHGLQVLTLDWDIGETRFDPYDYQRQLEDLKPHLDLKGLTLLGYEGSSLLHSWLNPRSNLVKISIKKCSKCTCLPPFDQFPSLQVLALDEMANLQFINSSEEKPARGPFFPELRELQLTELPQLQGWWKADVFSYDDADLPSFSQLSKLSIMNCPSLRSTMPLFPTLKEELVLDTTSWAPFRETMKRSQGDLPLTNLCLVGIHDFDKGEMVKYMWDKLKSLRVLRLDYIQELEGLLEGFRHATSLQELEICRCSIKAIPDWIGDLKLLKKLSISVCPMMTSLPKEISGLTSLQTLEIDDCPTLQQ